MLCSYFLDELPVIKWVFIHLLPVIKIKIVVKRFGGIFPFLKQEAIQLQVRTAP
jgi:hypothetical protein